MSLSSECPASLKTPDRDSLIRIISELTTRILNLEEENKELKNLIQAMKDEIRRLKGEKGRPTIKPSLPDNPPAAKKQQRSKKWKKSAKTITRRVRLPISKELLPEDARYKGTRRIVIQDLRIEPDNVEFELERYYSARERKTYESRLPPGYEGSSFGPGIRHLVLALHYQARMPQKLLQTFLLGMGVRISEGEVAFLLVISAARFQAEHEAACRAGVQKHGYQHIDDTGARLQGKNGTTIVTGNESFVAYRTGNYKNRLAALRALWRTDMLCYSLDEDAIAYVKRKLPHTTLDTILRRFKTHVYSDGREFEEKVLGHPSILRFNPQALRYVREAAAITAFRASDPTKRLVCDDANQFKGLTVLSFPQIPLHNNPCELDVREKVLQRKIRNCHRSTAGARASDLFLGLMGTCRKNKISYWKFLKDRIYQTHTIPELQKIIASSPPRASPTATSY